MSKKSQPQPPVTTFERFETAAKRILSVSKKDFDKAVASRPRRSKKPRAGN